MSVGDTLREQLNELNGLLDATADQHYEAWSPEWMNQQSLLTRQANLLHEIEVVDGEYQLEVALVGNRVLGSKVEATFLGKFLEELQATIHAVGQAIMFGSGQSRGGAYPADVVNAATLRLVATHPGSFVLGLEGPLRERQLSFGQEADDEALPVFDEAVARVLNVIDVIEQEVAGERLPEAVSDLGGKRPIQNLIKLSHLLAQNGTGAVTVDRSPFLSEVRESRLTSGGARRLETVLKRTEQSTSRVQVRGILTGVRWKTGVFDLETETGEGTISGKVVSELRDSVRNHFDQSAEFVLEQTLTRTEVHDLISVSYRLVGIIDPDRPQLDIGSS